MAVTNLTKAEVNECRKAIVKCQEWGEQLKVNQSCGIDCQDAMEEQRMALDFLTRVNNHYGPQYPTKG